MTRVDQFESVFKAAAKTLFEFSPVEIGSVLIVTDLSAPEAESFAHGVRAFLKVIEDGAGVSWRVVQGEEFSDVAELLDLVKKEDPELIVSYRNLHSNAWRWPYSLGEYLDVLTQESHIPVVVLPHPLGTRADPHSVKNTDTVVAMTDHLTGDHRLVNYAVTFTQRGGTLTLGHIEDRASFDRTIDAISKIPTIDTETAREDLLAQLLREPSDYIDSCARILEENGVSLQLEKVVTVGHHYSEYTRLIEEKKVDLLVMNTKDEDQLAMHGLAYPIAVGIRNIPLLLL